MDDYDVFLNHRGPDVKGGFVAHLDDALRAVGLNPFLDKKSLVKGGPAFRSIDDALDVAKIHVAVVSRGYAESKYCLSELVAMMRSGKPVIPVFYDVEPAELRRVENGQLAAAFEKHKSRETSEQVEEWADALRKLADITGFCFRLSDYEGDEAELKHKVVDAVLSVMPTIGALQVEHHLVGMEEHLNTCINKLETMSDGIGLLCLVGMGGIGKTCLAKEIYNHFIGHKKFQAMSFLEIDRNLPSSMEVGTSILSRLQKQLLWDLLRVPNNFHQSYKYWFHKLSSKGPALIVLDDIQDKRQYDKLILNTSLLAPGSRIIVTSRDQHLLKVVAGKTEFYIHEVRTLGCDDSEKLFNWHAFGDEEAPKNFSALAHVVSKACGGLPLALKVVGSSLFDKRSDEDRECIWPEAVDALKGDPDITTVLKWSYDCLSESEKLMFVDIACVFHGWKKQEALEIWKSCKKCSSCCGCGSPHSSLRKLIDKSLVVIENSTDEDVLGMHGLLRDMGEGIGMVDGSHLWEDRAGKVFEDNNQGANKVRALNLANSQKHKFEAENFAKMPNLHFLVLDGCDMHGDLGSISKELRWMRWRYMPLTHLPLILDLSNLISLDFSKSTKLVNVWAESDLVLEACPNLLRLNLSNCTSITTLPDSIRHLSRLQVLNLSGCRNLQKLPSSIGQLAGLQVLSLCGCGSLEALPDSVTALSGLRELYMDSCSSISKLPTSIGLMKSLTELNIDLATECQAVAVGQFTTLRQLIVTQCADEAISVLDSSGALRNLDQLFFFMFLECRSMTKLPETIGLLTNLQILALYGCEKLQELPNSIGQLNVLGGLYLRECSSLETLPDSLGAWTSLEFLCIVQCTSITELPTSIGHLSSLCELRIQGCGGLQSLPHSLRQLNALHHLIIMDCGSLEGLGALRMVQGLRIWGCTSIRELPGSRLFVLDSNFGDPAWFDESMFEEWSLVRRNLKEWRVLEANDCGFLRHVQDTESGRFLLQRVHNLPCSLGQDWRVVSGPQCFMKDIQYTSMFQILTHRFKYSS